MAAPIRTFKAPVLTEAPHRFVLYRHHVIDHAELQQTLGKTFGDLYARIGQVGATPAGPPFVIFNEESDPGVRWDMDVCAPVSEPISGEGDLKSREMPAEPVVSLVHIGPYETLTDAYEAVDWFIRDNNLTPTGPFREFYLSEPTVEPQDVQTLVERPVL